MNVNKKIISALQDIAPTCPDHYAGTEDVYIVFNYLDDRAAVYADDEPQQDTAIIRINLYTPLGFNYTSIKQKIRSRLFRAGFSYPNIEPLAEDDCMHVVFECSMTDQSEIEEE